MQIQGRAHDAGKRFGTRTACPGWNQHAPRAIPLKVRCTEELLVVGGDIKDEADRDDKRKAWN